MSIAREKYCAFCGKKFDTDKWPRLCTCGEWTYRNPLPVVNILLPLLDAGRTGILIIQRGIEPCYGEWALPGGYMELGESWQTAGVRELYEETGTRLESPESLTLLCVEPNRKRDRILIFGVAPTKPLGDLAALMHNDEVLDMRVIYAPETLAFVPHTKAVAQFFDALKN